MSLTLAPAEQVAIAVGNQLRIANGKLDQLIYGLRPYDLLDELMEDLCGLDPEDVPWAIQRRTFLRSPNHRRKMRVEIPCPTCNRYMGTTEYES